MTGEDEYFIACCWPKAVLQTGINVNRATEQWSQILENVVL
jgi:hypothetical protein